ncbi:hypothetical protein OSB04_019162 [Centaurea solstitialis]|uniref:Uncharacterized protein n=1 Tax=Centaurea solstitialis TaxID=347529 RepID=A0AA38WDZ2_9ASTR|nr:hypothetical protein OSB04_019162 [Centaurea solstitialis]
MANPLNTNFMSISSQSKPPTLVREEFQQWKIRMVNFLEGIHPRITEYLHNPPYIPVKLIPRVPATATTAEVLEYCQSKRQIDWDDEDKEMARLAPKCKRLLIMALPNDIFMSLDYCPTSKELWGTNEDNNMLFLKNLGTEWLHLSMSMKTNLDLEIMSLADLYGSLASLEPQVLQLKSSIGGPLALVAEGAKGKGEKKPTEERKKKKKALVTESEDAEDMSSEEEMSTRDMMKTLVSFTRDY